MALRASSAILALDSASEKSTAVGAVASAAPRAASAARGPAGAGPVNMVAPVPNTMGAPNVNPAGELVCWGAMGTAGEARIPVPAPPLGARHPTSPSTNRRTVGGTVPRATASLSALIGVPPPPSSARGSIPASIHVRTRGMDALGDVTAAWRGERPLTSRTAAPPPYRNRYSVTAMQPAAQEACTGV